MTKNLDVYFNLHFFFFFVCAKYRYNLLKSSYFFHYMGLWNQTEPEIFFLPLAIMISISDSYDINTISLYFLPFVTHYFEFSIHVKFTHRPGQAWPWVALQGHHGLHSEDLQDRRCLGILQGLVRYLLQDWSTQLPQSHVLGSSPEALSKSESH